MLEMGVGEAAAAAAAEDDGGAGEIGLDEEEALLGVFETTPEEAASEATDELLDMFTMAFAWETVPYICALCSSEWQ